MSAAAHAGASRQPLHGIVGCYRAAGGQRRRLVLSTDGEAPVLFDRSGNDERVVERFAATAGLLEVAAVAAAYLADARRLGRPVVAAGEPDRAPGRLGGAHPDAMTAPHHGVRECR